MLFLCHTFSRLFECILGTWIIIKIYPSRNLSWLKMTFLIIAYTIWAILGVRNTWESFVSNIFLLVDGIIYSLLNCGFVKSRYTEMYIWESLYLNTISLLKMPLLVLNGVLQKKSIFEVNRAKRNYLEILGCLLILSFIYVCFGKRKELYEIIQTLLAKSKRRALLLAISEWCMISYSMYLGKRGYETVDLMILSLFILSIVVFILYLMLNVLYQKVQGEKAVLSASQNILQKQNENLQIMYDLNCQRMHETKHKLLYLINCLEQGKENEGLKYLYTLMEEMTDKEKRIWTGFTFLDFILNYKKSEIDAKEIEFKMEIEVYELPFDKAELGIVLCNLFDNAIEAAEKCAIADRKIFFKLKNINSMLFLYMRNSSIQSPVLKNGEFLSSKQYHYAHGWGIKNVKNVIEKYEGSMTFEYDDEHFEINILV